MKTIHTALAMLIVIAAAMLGATADARFLANDPVPFDPNNPAQFNRYAYGWNDPINMVDPTGRFPNSFGRSLGLAIELQRGNITPAQFDASMRTTMQGESAGTFIGSAISAAGTAGYVGCASGGCAGAAILGGEILAGEALGPAGAASLAGTAAVGATRAASAMDGASLQRQLVSQEQVGRLAEGGGTVLSQPAKQAARIAEQYGVSHPSNVQKVSSEAHQLPNGVQVETHAFRDAANNTVIEPKEIERLK